MKKKELEEEEVEETRIEKKLANERTNERCIEPIWKRIVVVGEPNREIRIVNSLNL